MNIESSRCQAKTIEGNECKRVKSGEVYCSQHEKMYGVMSTKKCKATTTSGKKCKRNADFDYCFQHSKNLPISPQSNELPLEPQQMQKAIQSSSVCRKLDFDNIVDDFNSSEENNDVQSSITNLKNTIENIRFSRQIEEHEFVDWINDDVTFELISFAHKQDKLLSYVMLKCMQDFAEKVMHK